MKADKKRELPQLPRYPKYQYNITRELVEVFIRTQELEWILTHYRELQAMLQELRTEADAVLSEKESDGIYACMLKRTLDNMPPSGKISDRTAGNALNIHRLSQEQRMAMEEINEDVLLIDLLLQKIEIALRVVKPCFREVVVKKHIEQKTWREVSTELKYEIRTLRRHRDQAVEKILTICRIQFEDFAKVKHLLERL